MITTISLSVLSPHMHPTHFWNGVWNENHIHQGSIDIIFTTYNCMAVRSYPFTCMCNTTAFFCSWVAKVLVWQSGLCDAFCRKILERRECNNVTTIFIERVFSSLLWWYIDIDALTGDLSTLERLAVVGTPKLTPSSRHTHPTFAARVQLTVQQSSLVCNTLRVSWRWAVHKRVECVYSKQESKNHSSHQPENIFFSPTGPPSRLFWQNSYHYFRTHHSKEWENGGLVAV